MKDTISKLNIPDEDIWAVLDSSGHTMIQIISKEEPTQKEIDSLLSTPKIKA